MLYFQTDCNFIIIFDLPWPAGTTTSLMFQGIPWWRRFWGLGYQFRFGPELLPVLSGRVVKALGTFCRYYSESGVPCVQSPALWSGCPRFDPWPKHQWKMEEAKILLPVIATQIEIWTFLLSPHTFIIIFDLPWPAGTTTSLMFQGIPWWRRFWGLGYQFRFGSELLPVLSGRVVKALGTFCRYYSESGVPCVQSPALWSGVPGSIPGQNISEKWKRQKSFCSYCSDKLKYGPFLLSPHTFIIIFDLPWPAGTMTSLMFQGIPWWRRFWGLGYQFRFGPELLPVLSGRVVKALGTFCRYYSESGVPCVQSPALWSGCPRFDPWPKHQWKMEEAKILLPVIATLKLKYGPFLLSPIPLSSSLTCLDRQVRQHLWCSKGSHDDVDSEA